MYNFTFAMRISFILFVILLTFDSCKQEKKGPPADYFKQLLICDKKFNFDSLASIDRLGKDDYRAYEQCMCNTTIPNVELNLESGTRFLHDFKGKPMVLYTWNKAPEHLENMRMIKELCEGHQDTVKLIRISLEDPYSPASEIPAELKVFENALAGVFFIDDNIQLKERIFPMVFFIDKNAVLQDLATGSTFSLKMDKESRRNRLKKGIDKIFN